MWAQDWTDLFQDVKPFSGKSRIDITDKLVQLVSKLDSAIIILHALAHPLESLNPS